MSVKKGFTLVEMLAVIMVLVVIVGVVVTSAFSLVNKNREEQYDVLVSEVLEAVKIYLNDNYENNIIGRESKYFSVKFFTDNLCSASYIQLKELVDSGLINKDSLIDTRTNTKIDINNYVKVYYDGASIAIDSEFGSESKGVCSESSTIVYNNSNYFVKTSNNYVSLNNQLYRIISINSDGSMRLILNGNIGSSVFGSSLVYEESYVLSSVQYWYIYNVTSAAKEVIKENAVSILTKSEYYYLKNNNLVNSNIGDYGEFWILDGSNGVTTNGGTNPSANNVLVRPVIEISSRAIYVSGDGSSTNPYTIR